MMCHGTNCRVNPQTGSPRRGSPSSLVQEERRSERERETERERESEKGWPVRAFVELALDRSKL